MQAVFADLPATPDLPPPIDPNLGVLELRTESADLACFTGFNKHVSHEQHPNDGRIELFIFLLVFPTMQFKPNLGTFNFFPVCPLGVLNNFFNFFNCLRFGSQHVVQHSQQLQSQQHVEQSHAVQQSGGEQQLRVQVLQEEQMSQGVHVLQGVHKSQEIQGSQGVQIVHP